jgi:sn-glycerol 3-phosphate transport system permease protein
MATTDQINVTTKTDTQPQQHRPQAPRTRTRWGVHIGLILICFVVSLPAFFALGVATLTAEQALERDPPRLLPPGDNPADIATTAIDEMSTNIDSLFTERNQFDRMFWNTLVISLVVAIGKIVTGMLAGLAFVYFKFPGKWILFFFVLLTLLMPTEIIILPLSALMGDLEWVRTNPRLALTIPFIGSAIGAFLFRQHFNNIPRELVEAAQIDGASPLRFLFSILLPMSWNIIGALAVIQFIYMWNQYIWPVLIINDDADQMIQVGVRLKAATGTPDYGLLMAAGIVASLPPLLVFVILQKQFMNGFAITRDK